MNRDKSQTRFPSAPRRRRARRGFSLIDMMVAFTIFSVAILVTLALLPSAQQSVRKSRLKTMAAHVAQYQMEQVVNQAFASVTTRTPSPVVLTTVVNGSRDLVAFSSQVTVTTVSTTVKDVVCTVTWTENGAVRNTTVETLVADRS